MKAFLLLIYILYPFLFCIGQEQEIDFSDLNKIDGVFYTKDSNKEYTGKIISRYSMGAYQEIDCVDGVLNGFYKSWFRKDLLHKEGQIVNGKFEGIVKEYYESGELYIMQIYKDGKLDGSLKNYYKNGILKTEVQYEKGNVILMQTYDEDGELLHSQRQGEPTIYYKKATD